MSERDAGPAVVLELGGVEYPLHLSMAAVGDFNDATGINLLEGGLTSKATREDPSRIVALVWAMAGGPDTGRTLREFAAGMQVADMPRVAEAITRVMARDLPQMGAPVAPRASAPRAAKKSA